MCIKQSAWQSTARAKDGVSPARISRSECRRSCSRGHFLGTGTSSSWGSASTIAPPPGFPSDIPLSQQAYANWSREIMLDSVWTATARHSDDVVTLANWRSTTGTQCVRRERCTGGVR